MKIVAQMDDIFSINKVTDTTFLILLEAQKRGHEIYYYTPSTISFDVHQQNVSALISKIILNNSSDFCQIIEKKHQNLIDFDVVLVRQDPPFDMNYLTTTYLLEKIKDQILIINNPHNIRNCPEKLFVTNFPKYTPPTVISNDINIIKEFQQKFKEIIIKPLYSFGAEGIILINKNGDNLSSVFEMMKKLYKTPVIAQKFISEVKNGDKRIFLLDGEPIGAVSRFSSDNEIRCNLHIGGNAKKTELNSRDYEICNAIKPYLSDLGLILVGIDVIGDYLTEINVTSPTCIPEINLLNAVKLEEKILYKIEEKFEEFTSKKKSSTVLKN